MENIDTKALNKISYGLFVITSRADGKDNGCIINTAMQLTSSPLTVAVCVNKANYTCEMIKKSGVFNLSALTEKTGFDVYKRFGFASGADTDKFEGFDGACRADNHVLYVGEKYANSLISCRVKSANDVGTHILFVAEVTEAKVLNDEKSVTYAYYHENVKPKPEKKEEKKKGYVCKICGYVYEGEELPEDYICPICKHPASDFEKL